MNTPTPQDLRDLAAALGLTMSAGELDEFGGVVTSLLAPIDPVANAMPVPPTAAREYWAPAGNPLGAWRWRTEIAGAPTGALAGRTVAVKDSISVAGVPMANGSKVFAEYVPRYDATIVERVLGAGARITGTAVCEELCVSGGSHTSWPTIVRNPANPAYSSGGSSSGSAALVASGEVDIALGSDVGGSVRIPAAWCGVYGLKPTHGLIPFTGTVGITQRLDHMGILTRTVADLAAVLGSVSGADGHDPRQATNLAPRTYAIDDQTTLRVAVLAEGFGFPESDPRVDAHVRACVEALSRAGHGVETVSVPEHLLGNHARNVMNAAGFAAGFGPAVSASGSTIGPWAERMPGPRPDSVAVESFGPTVIGLALAGAWANQHAPHALGAAQRLAVRLAAAYDAVLDRADVILMPTVPKLPYRLPTEDMRPSEEVFLARSIGGNTGAFNLTGHPAGTIPSGTIDGLPVGIMAVARHWREDVLLNAMAVIGRDLEAGPGAAS